MSKPSFENIDRWFFEYSEGNLSPAQVEEFESFLAAHPELKQELELWEDAKVTEPEMEDVAIAALKRPVLPVASILTYSGIGVLGILIGFGLSYYFQEAPAYQKSPINAEIINVENEPIFADKILRTGETKSPSESSKELVNKSNGFTVNETSKDDFSSGHVSLANQVNNKVQSNGNNPIADQTDRTEEPTNLTLNEEPAGRDVKAKELPVIVDYLNGDRNIVSKDDVAANQKKKVEVSSAFKRKMKSVFRKIKRMADQPIALKNTKDQYFHVPMMTGFAANYGMVGSARGNRLQLTSRNQYVGHANQQLQNTISWDSYVYALRGGLGVDVTYNRYQNDAIQNYAAALTYSPKFSLNKNVSIEPALRFKMGAIDVNSDSPILGSDVEMIRSNLTPLFADGQSPIGTKLWYRDVGASVMLNTKWFYAGLNVDNIGRHYNNYYSSDIKGDHRASTHFTGIIGTEYESLTKEMKVSGYALYQNYGELNELWGGVNAQFRWLQAGVATSSNLGLAASLGVVMDNVSLHYNLDKTESALKGEKLLSHQLTLRILMKPSRYAAKFLNM